MATGASNADLAILLVDARKGLLTQTHRHAIIASLLGVRHVVLAVNKIDLVDYDEATFRRIVAAFTAFAEPLDFRSLVAIPISARYGDNISAPSPRTPWHDGPYLIDYLERVEVEDDRAARAVPPAGAMGQPARTWISAASPARSPAAAIKRGDADRRRCVRPQQRGDRHSARRRGGRGGRSRRRGDADARRRSRHRARRRAGAARRRGPRSPTSSPPI